MRGEASCAICGDSTTSWHWYEHIQARVCNPCSIVLVGDLSPEELEPEQPPPKPTKATTYCIYCESAMVRIAPGKLACRTRGCLQCGTF